MQDYTENHPDVEILDPNIIVFHNALSDPDAYIDYYEEYGEWRGWYGFGRQIDGRGHTFTAHPTFPTWDEWEEVLLRDDGNPKEDLYRREVAQSFHLATKFYREFTGKDLPNWSCQPWGLARYIPDEDLLGDPNLTMNYHTDYMVEDTESEGAKFGITAVIYPNDDYEGGELSFRVKGEDGVERSFDYKPRAGDLVMFPSGPPYFHAVKRIYGSPKYITRLYWEYEYEGSEDWHRLKAKYGDRLEALEQDRKRRSDIRVLEPTPRCRFTLKEYYELLDSGWLLPDYRHTDKAISPIQVDSLEGVLAAVDNIVKIFKDKGLVVIKGYRFSTEDQIALVKALGDILNWDINSGASEMALNSSIYFGGHSDNTDREYQETVDQYILDWHIEQVYYVHPILAGVWNMTDFTAAKGHGNTRFVDSIELLEGFSQEDRDFLSKSIVTWDKQAPSGQGPYFTKAVDFHPISGKPLLRIETDRGCKSFPELFMWDGRDATGEEKDRFSRLQTVIKDALNTNEGLRYSQEWEEDDLLIVDLFRMYHAVMGGFSFGERKFTGMGLRPISYDGSLHTDLGLL